MRRTFLEDAWSNGQIESKLWMCRKLEMLQAGGDIGRDLVVWVLGGWVGVLPFLLLSRERLSVNRIRSFDIDPMATEMADMFNENWVFADWKFKAITADANYLHYEGSHEHGPPPDLVINTSAEHMDRIWFGSLPAGTTVAVQTTDMKHCDHLFTHTSIRDLLNDFPLGDVLFRGAKAFVYPDLRFSRFMTIGHVL